MRQVEEYVTDAMRTLAANVADNSILQGLEPAAAMTLNATTGIASEAGEINEIIKKRYFHGHPRTEEGDFHMKRELGDLMWYVALMCHAQGFELGEILKMNIEKLRARYPEGFSTERSMNRAPGDV